VRLSEEYYLKYLSDDNLTSIEEVAKTPLWSAYMARNIRERQEGFMQQNVADFLAAMKRSGEHLQYSTLEITPSLQPLLDLLLPFVKKYTPVLGVAPS